jgi:tetratricopeptide (TPR) repeat protein
MNSPLTGEEAARLKRQGAEQAIQLALESKWEEAAALNRTILATHPADVDAWNRLGKSLLELGRYREARDSYGQSVALDPVNTIARKNFDRLQTLAEAENPSRSDSVTKAPQDLFIEEIGKTGVTVLQAPTTASQVLTAGDEVYLKPGEELINVEDLKGEILGSVEPKLGLRLLRMIQGGNKYAAAVKSIDDDQVELIIKEIYRDPSQTRLSFPAVGGEGVRPYIKESLLRLGNDDDDDDEVEEVDTEDWETEPEQSSESTVTFSSFQNTIERDVDDDDEEA